MKLKVKKLFRQNSDWSLKESYLFYNRHYEIDDLGNFYRNGIKVKVKPDKKNNLTVCLTNDKNERVRFKIHQIILQTFRPSFIRNYHSVDHIDRDRLNNKLSNLRFADKKTQYGNRENKSHKLKPVMCLNTNVVYPSCRDAEIKLKLTFNTVSPVARGSRKSIKGYSFDFV